MPIEPLPENFQEADAAAEALAAQQRSGGFVQDVPAPSSLTTGADSSSSVLDDLFKKVGEPSQDPSVGHGLENGGVRNRVEGEPEEPEAPVKPADTVPPVAPAAPAAPAEPAQKSLLEELAGTTPAAPVEPKAPADPYANIQLRSDASQKTKDTFAEVKRIAAERESAAAKRADEVEVARAALEKEAAELRTRVQTAEARTATPEIEAELKELRGFRAQFDAENDPEFKSRFDTKLDTNYSSIYEVLKRHALPDTEVEKLKALPAQDREAAIENFLDALPAASRRLIEAKLIENAGVHDQRKGALQEIRSKADEVIAKRAKDTVDAQEKRDREAADTLRPIIERLPWIHDRAAPSTATEAEKADIAKHNKFAAEARQHLQESLLDDSPKVRAQAALAVPVAIHLRHELNSANDTIAALQKELEGIRKASQTSRMSRTSAVPAASTKPASKSPESTEDALDALFREASGKK